jgi:putative pre-16S rRNA nuclease
MKKRIIGIDYGLVRIGVAISDERKIIASPLMTHRAAKDLKQTAHELIEALNLHSQTHKYEIEEIVIGLPLLMSGKEGAQADQVLSFIEHLKKETSIPIQTWDERLTSLQAEKLMKEGGLSRKSRAKVVDRVAAVIILQNYLGLKYPN